MMLNTSLQKILFALVVLLGFALWNQERADADASGTGDALPQACAKRRFTVDECDTIANIGAGALWGYLQGLPADRYNYDATQGDKALQCRLREVVRMAFDGSQDGVHPKRYGAALYQECTKPLIEARL